MGQMLMIREDLFFQINRSIAGNELYVVIEPSKVHGRIDIHDLMEAILSGGYGDYQIHQDAICELAEYDFSHENNVIKRKIAESANARVSVTISEDAMSAWLTVEPACGGEAVTRAMITQALQESGVCFGIQDPVIIQAIEQGYLPNTLVAKGIPAQQGRSAWFEYLVQENTQRPQEMEDGSVDHRELNIVTSVPEGSPLMRKHPVIPAQAGRTVLNEEIPVEKGQDFQLIQGFGSAICPEDPHLLIATMGGKPVRGACSVRIDNVFTVACVGIETGHIRFDGSVIVNGPVESGFEIHASGDIEVEGTVEAAHLEAGGNIYIRGGVVGNGKARLIAGGSIRANFIEKAHVECNQNLFVQESLLHSTVRAAGNVILGINNGKGQLSGGELQASHEVKARVLGSPASTNTMIAVGMIPQFRDKLKVMENEMETYKKQLTEKVKAIVYLRTRGKATPQEIATLETERDQLLYHLDVLKESTYKLKTLLTHVINPGRVIGLSHIYAGVNLSFRDVRKMITEDLAGSSFSLHGTEEIVLGPITRQDMEMEENWNLCA